MPCFTITTIELQLRDANLELLKNAIKEVTGKDATIYNAAMLWDGGQYQKISGRLVVRDEKTGQNIKRAYSAELVKAQAKRFGWQVKKTDEYKYQIIKR